MVGPHDPSRGVLALAQALQRFQIERPEPSVALRPWVENYWEVTWNLPPGVSHRQTNLSHAAINIVIEDDGTWLYGVPGPTFVREISGQGRAFGIKFHPGAFFPWAGVDLHFLFDQRVPLEPTLDSGWTSWAEDCRGQPLERAVEITNGFLEARRPSFPGEARRCAQRLQDDRTLLKVEDACRVLGYDLRGLQRLFRREVGVSPKEVLKRYRLMEAAERLAHEPEVSGAALAASLGYSDQAHFIRDFKAVTGVSPEGYRRAVVPG